jgi:hypothetical protein
VRVLGKGIFCKAVQQSTAAADVGRERERDSQTARGGRKRKRIKNAGTFWLFTRRFPSQCIHISVHVCMFIYIIYAYIHIYIHTYIYIYIYIHIHMHIHMFIYHFRPFVIRLGIVASRKEQHAEDINCNSAGIGIASRALNSFQSVQPERTS